jgi:HAE1 family hydrophobic/amphiphilic exporter-1
MERRKKTPELDGVFLSDTSIKQPVFITMIMLLLIVLGLMTYSTMPVDLYPDFEVPVVGVQLIYPGASPDSVAEQVAKPVEDAVISVNGLDDITSTSYEGAALLTLEFETGIDVDIAEQDVRSKVNAAMPRLPAEVEDPLFFKFDPGEIPVISLAIFGTGERSSIELRKLVEDDIVPFIQRIDGVGSVPVNGGQERQINVLLNLDKLQARQILPAYVTRSIQNANINLGMGSIDAGNLEINLRAPSMLETPQDIADIQITGTPYRVGDVATIEDGIAEVTTYARLNGEEAITVNIIKRPDANVVEVAHSVRKELDKIFAAYPDLDYTVPMDTSKFVEESVDGAIEELFVASLAAMLIVFVFFQSIRNTLVTIIGLPVILIGTFAAISLFGLTINVITLMGLSLSVGLVIDDAIVVRENIFRHTEMGSPPIIASSRATAEVSLSVVAMTLTVIAVFVPVTFTTGIPGIIFKSFGITVACAMALSLFEAFTLAPMTSAHLFREKKESEKKKKKNKHASKTEAEHTPAHQPAETALSLEKPSAEGEQTHTAEHTSTSMHESHEVDWMGRAYGGLLKWSLRHRFIIVLLVIGIAVGSFYAASGLKMAFFPTTDQGEFYVGFELPPGSKLETTNEFAMRAEEIIRQHPAVDSYLTTVGGGGGSGLGGGGGTPEQGQVFVKLHKEHPPTSDVIEELRPQLDFLPTLAFGQEGHGSNSSQVTGRDIQLQVNTNRPLEELIPFLLMLQQEAGQVEGLADIDTTYNPGKPELQIIADPSKIGNLGITNDDLASSIRTLINGSKAGVFRKDGEDTDIEVRLKPGDRASVEDIKNIYVPTLSGSVPIGSLVDIKLEASSTSIRRYNRVNQIIIGANVIGRNVAEVTQELQGMLNTIEPPEGVELRFGGDTEDMAEGFTTMLIAMGLSVLFVYMVLASQFGSFFQPFVIMLAMPFSFLGSFLALQIAGFELDMISIIGLIMLMGLVVKNSILLIDFTNRLRREGMDKHSALVQAGAIRLRPILMTSMALIAGATPVAIGMGEGAEIRQGLSIVIIGGMITSTLLTLLVVPTAYSLLEGAIDLIRRILSWRPGRKKKQPDPDHSEGSQPAEEGAWAGSSGRSSASDSAHVAYARLGDEPSENLTTQPRTPGNTKS